MPNDNSAMGERVMELIRKRESKMYGYYRSVFEDGFEGGYPIAYDQEIVDEIKSEIDRAVGEREREIAGRVKGMISLYPTSYNGKPFMIPVGWSERLESDVIRLITKQS